MRDIQLLVAGHKKGDTPDDPKDPALMTRTFVFELDARRQALLQQVRAIVEAERGEYVDNADVMEAMCMAVLRGGAADQVRLAPQETGASTAMQDNGQSAARRLANQKAPRPAHQIVIRRCDDCSRAWQQGKGMLVPITNPDLELAACDAELIREADLLAAQAAGTRRPAPTLSIPKKTRDRVMARDQGRCRFPGCRATRHVAIHHIVHRILGGEHEEWNLFVLCDGHHKLLHDGVVSISGRAPDQLVFMRAGKTLVDARAPAEQEAAATLRTDTVNTNQKRSDLAHARERGVGIETVVRGHQRHLHARRARCRHDRREHEVIDDRIIEHPLSPSHHAASNTLLQQKAPSYHASFRLQQSRHASRFHNFSTKEQRHAQTRPALLVSHVVVDRRAFAHRGPRCSSNVVNRKATGEIA